MHKFRKLKIWQRSMLFISEVYKVSYKYPKHELFGLVDQLRRAATAVALNIAEGSGAGTDKEFARFLYSKMAKTTGVNPWMKPSNEREAHKAEQKTATVRSSDFYIALRSLYEVVTALEVALMLNYGIKQDNQKLIIEADEIGAMISGFIKTLRKSDS